MCKPRSHQIRRNNHHRTGYRLLDIFKDSPAESASCTSFQDVIVEVNRQSVDVLVEKQKARFDESSTGPLVDIIKENENKAVTLTVFNGETNQTRQIVVTPNSEWSGSKGALLGVVVRFDPVNWQDVLLDV